MKKLITILLIFICYFSEAQIDYTPMSAGGYAFKYLRSDSGFAVPFRNLTTGRGTTRPGSIIINTVDSLFYGWNGITWGLLGGQGKIDSVVLREGTDSVFTYINDVATFVFRTSSGSGGGNELAYVDFTPVNPSLVVFERDNGELDSLEFETINPVTTVAGLRAYAETPLEDVIYQTIDYGGGDWLWDPASTATDDLGTVLQITGVPTGRFIRQFTGPVMLEWFGGVADGVTDNTTAINNAIIAVNARGGGILKFPVGVVKVNGQINLLDKVYLEGQGIGATTLDMSTATVTDAFIYAAGSLTALPALSANINAGDLTVTYVSAPGLAAGDAYMAYNPTDFSFSLARDYYRKGEYFRVNSISGSVVTNSNNAYDSYTSGSVNMYKLNTVTVGVSAMTINFKPGVTLSGINVSIGTLCEFKNLKLSGSRGSHINLDRCFNININGIDIFDNQATVGENYGIVISNSQRINISDCHVETSRHGIANGGSNVTGSVPNRQISISDSYIGSLQAATGYALDFHGNSEDYSVTNCFIPGGINISGDRATISNNRIGNNFLGQAVRIGEQLGANFLFQNNVFTAYQNYTRLFDCTPTFALTRSGGVFSFKNNRFLIDTFHSATYPAVQSSVVYFSVLSDAATEDWTLEFDGNTFITTNTTAGAFYGIYINTIAAKGIRKVIVKNNTMTGCGFYIRPNYSELIFENNTILDPLERGFSLFELTAPSIVPQETHIKGNTIKRAKVDGMYLYQRFSGQTFSNVYITGNTSINNGKGAAGYYSAFIYGAKELTLKDNIFGDTLATPDQAGTYYIDSIQTLHDGYNENVGFGKNSLTAGFGYVLNDVGISHYKNIRQAWGLAAPTTGTWTRGDKVYNTLPTTLGVIFWICTLGGTPGTWVESYGGGTQTLQQTTTNGATSTDVIKVGGLGVNIGAATPAGAVDITGDIWVTNGRLNTTTNYMQFLTRAGSAWGG